MRVYLFPLAAIVSLAFACHSGAAEKPQPAHANEATTKKVWTNDDVDDLRARGLISIIGSDVSQAAVQPAPPHQSIFPVHSSRLQDPAWYAEQASDLQAELDRRQTLLRQQQEALALAPQGITQPGVAMDQPSYGLTPQYAVANLAAQVSEVQNQLDDLSDLARRNDIPPGVLRG